MVASRLVWRPIQRGKQLLDPRVDIQTRAYQRPAISVMNVLRSVLHSSSPSFVENMLSKTSADSAVCKS
jgi:hypothetical protein